MMVCVMGRIPGWHGKSVHPRGRPTLGLAVMIVVAAVLFVVAGVALDLLGHGATLLGVGMVVVVAAGVPVLVTFSNKR